MNYLSIVLRIATKCDRKLSLRGRTSGENLYIQRERRGTALKFKLTKGGGEDEESRKKKNNRSRRRKINRQKERRGEMGVYEKNVKAK